MESGFAAGQSSENKDASFAVYRKDGVEITLALWHATGEFAVMIDKPATITPLAAENVNAVTVPKVIEPGLEYDGALCYNDM